MATERASTLEELVTQARVTNRLLAAQLRTAMSQSDLVDLLKDLGLTARQLGDVVGTSPATVAVTLQRLRHKRKRNKEEA